MYLRCQNNVESVSPTGGARSSMADAGETETDLTAICFHLLSVLLPFCLKPALSTNVSTQSPPGPHKTGRDMLLAHFKAGTTGPQGDNVPGPTVIHWKRRILIRQKREEPKHKRCGSADTHGLLLVHSHFQASLTGSGVCSRSSMLRTQIH